MGAHRAEERNASGRQGGVGEPTARRLQRPPADRPCVPNGVALSGQPQQRMREFAAITGVTIVDLLPVYRAYRPEELYLRNAMIPSDPSHPSVKGNQVAADEIFRVFKPSLIDSISTRTEAHTKNSEPGSGEPGHEFPVAR